MVLSCKRSFPLLASPANAPEENTRADPIRRIETFDNFMNSSFNVSAATLCRTPHAPRAERILFALLSSESTRRGKSFKRRTARKVHRTNQSARIPRFAARKCRKKFVAFARLPYQLWYELPLQSHPTTERSLLPPCQLSSVTVSPFRQDELGLAAGPKRLADFFMSLNLPYPSQTALFVSCVELFGGIFLALGLLSRITALVLTVNMFVAYVTADREALLSVFSDPDKFHAAAPYTFLIASVIVLLFGPGKLALDALFRWLVKVPSLQETPAVTR